MAQILMLQHAALKAGNPNAQVVALACQRLRNANGSPHSEPFVQQVLGNMTQPASQHFDVIDWHDYRMGDEPSGPVAGPDPVRDGVQLMRKYADGKPMWNTEWGYKYASKFAPGASTAPSTAVDTNAPHTIYSCGGGTDSAVKTEELQAKYYVQQVATAFANGVDVQFYFNFDEVSAATLGLGCDWCCDSDGRALLRTGAHDGSLGIWLGRPEPRVHEGGLLRGVSGHPGV